MQRKLWIVVAALVVIGCLIAARTLFTMTVAPDAPPPPPSTEPPSVAPIVRSRVSIPRPAPKPIVDTDQEVEEVEDEHTDAPPSADTDPFPAVQGVKPELGEQLRSAMKEVTGELIDCLQGWNEAQPGSFEGRAIFAFHLDKDGLAELEVLDVQTIPEQTLACLGDVLWEEVEWPVVQDPVDVTWPVQVSVEPDED